jgi:hypothetical protein
MNPLMMAMLMKQQSSQGSDYDYDYEYGYADYDYDYEYDSSANSSPSPLSSIIQQMMQQKLAAHLPTVQVSSDPEVAAPIHATEATTPVSASDSLEIAPSKPQQDKVAHPSDQVSYRNAP